MSECANIQHIVVSSLIIGVFADFKIIKIDNNQKQFLYFKAYELFQLFGWASEASSDLLHMHIEKQIVCASVRDCYQTLG